MQDRPYYLSDKDAERLQTVTFGQLHQDFSVDEAVLTARLVRLCNKYNAACEIYANGGYLSKYSDQAQRMESTEDGCNALHANSDKAELERHNLPIDMQVLINNTDVDEYGNNRDRFHVVESGMYAYITFDGDRIPWQS
jgi:hypothetical protein